MEWSPEDLPRPLSPRAAVAPAEPGLWYWVKAGIGFALGFLLVGFVAWLASLALFASFLRASLARF